MPTVTCQLCSAGHGSVHAATWPVQDMAPRTALHKHSCSWQNGEVSLLRCAEWHGPRSWVMGKQWAVHWGCSMAGQAPQDSVVVIPGPVTQCVRSHLGSWQAEHWQGCHTVPGPQRCSLLPSQALAIAGHASEGSLTSHPAPAYLHLDKWSLLVCNGFFKKCNPFSYSGSRSSTAVLPNPRELLYADCKFSAVLMDTWFSKCYNSSSLNLHKHPSFTKKYCSTTELGGISCRSLSSTAVPP